MSLPMAASSAHFPPLTPTYPIPAHNDLYRGGYIRQRSNPRFEIEELQLTRRGLMADLASLRQSLDELEQNVHSVRSQANTFSSRRRASAGDSVPSAAGRCSKTHHTEDFDVFYDEESERIAINDHSIALLMQRSYDEEDAYLTLQFQQLSFPGIFECKICFDECSEEDVAEVEGCGHRLCRDCIKGHVTSQLEARVYPIMCPICTADKELAHPSALSHDLIEQIGLSKHDDAKFIELEMSQFSVIITCRGCIESFFVDREQLAEEKLITCPWPQCRKVWCKTCNQPLDDPKAEHTCDGSAELKRLVDSQKWKFCPGCNTPTEKSEGCNHMTCPAPGCNVHFCYFCGATIIKSKVGKEINAAKEMHYRTCTIFDEIPDVDVPP